MKRHQIAYLNALIILAILTAPIASITFANWEVEAGLLTVVGGHHVITLPFAYDLGIGIPNILAWTGLLIIIDTAIVAISTVGSSSKACEGKRDPR